MKTYYEWVEEKIERVHGEIDLDFNDPGELNRFCRIHENNEEYCFRIGLVRTDNNFDRSWVYFTQRDGFPAYFTDGAGRPGANVPQKLLKEFQKNEHWIKEKYSEDWGVDN